MSDAAKATMDRVEAALGEAGWAGRKLNARHGVITALPVAPNRDNLARLIGAWRFDEPVQGWAADALTE